MKNKTYKTITEVSKLLNLSTHVIRYWDSKLSISPQSNSKKQKFYNNYNINQLKELKDTLYQSRKYNYSLDSANKMFNKNKRQSGGNQETQTISDKKNIINKLEKINDNLKNILVSF